ncbi:hypothetical protein BABINDRAFT_162675 [Babjeviella inositovora NRRL Y-12698]|uniref:Kynurenine 3-monooxygenase n=1 Tax=Babjeviella inositovora NRRL Y-12698 TaxID=984486 RepID=A0A1E3QLW5_9ASCO|nr:uncharacterized protein BABINDRAFT_162675 [Babjeviella inositovora NRRL Y-12698]ODQ78454.1 hypothetical protein BABINDRAFT_162675 [Babjeviella inositovora NRRL Y-12698]
MSLESQPQRVAIVGAGLVGCLAALALANADKTNPAAPAYEVTLFEMRPDPRLQKASGQLRSINLAVSDRGIRALNAIDPQMARRVLAGMIPMYGRMIHHKQDSHGECRQESQQYGLYGEGINSIDRGVLNNKLLDELDAVGVQALFHHKLTSMGMGEKPTLFFNDETAPHEFDFILGCDGAFSATRFHLQKHMRMNFAQEYISKMYLELYIPPAVGADKFSIDKNHLHIWPRKDFMLIALANTNGSFTSTFFGDWDMSDHLVEGPDASRDVLELFERNFPDAIDLIGRDALVRAFATNPRGALVCTSCKPYNLAGKALILGDAAHSMVPFYGQGMNCGWEDVRVMMELLEESGFDTHKAFDKYSETRHEDLLAICDLAINNYREMASKVVDPLYLLRKKIDGWLSRALGERFWIPLYTMVSFRGDIPYAQVVKREARQQRILRRLVNGIVGGGFFAAVGCWWLQRKR